MGYIEQVKLVNDQAFLDQVRIAMASAAVAIQGEAVAPNSNTVFQKRQQLATKVLNDPDACINRFAWAVASNTSIVRGNPVAVVSSTNANPTVLTTATHGLSTGDVVVIAGHLVNTAANGNWTVTVLSATTVSIPMLASGVGGATGTVMKMPTDVAIQNQVNGVFNDIAGVTIVD